MKTKRAKYILIEKTTGRRRITFAMLNINEVVELKKLKLVSIHPFTTYKTKVGLKSALAFLDVVKCALCTNWALYDDMCDDCDEAREDAILLQLEYEYELNPIDDL